MTSHKLHSREFVQIIFSTKDAIAQLHAALKHLDKLEREYADRQRPNIIKAKVKAYNKRIADLTANAEELKRLSLLLKYDDQI